MTCPISPEPVLAWRPEFIPAYLSNGLIGLRAGPVPLLGGVTIVDGLAGIHPDEEVEGFGRAPYPFGGDIVVDGQSLRVLPNRAQLLEQRYDFGCGELLTRFSFAGPDQVVTCRVTNIISRTKPTLTLQEIQLEVDRPADIRLVAILDTTELPGRQLVRETDLPGQGNPLVDGCVQWEPPGGLTTCGAAYHTELTAGGAFTTKRDQNRLNPLSTTYELHVAPGETVVLRQLTSLVPSESNDQPHREASRLVSAAALVGFERLREENRNAWSELWRARPVLVGADDRWQRLADAAHYYLHASAHPSSLYSVSMFGLAYWPNYHYYRGQVMWDIEAFALPPLLLGEPDAARALLRFRERGLAAAEANAALHGRGGVQFPWAANPLNGQESIRTDIPMVTVEEHVNMAVARAFSLYADVVGSNDFREQSAWPVLSGVARWVETRACRTERGLEIRDTLGFAEGRDSPVDNDAYVNMTAAVALRDAARLAALLDHSEDAARWNEAARALYLARDESGVIRNHDRFSVQEDGPVGATPEALGGVFPFGYELPPEELRRTIGFYLDRVEPYLGSPMFSAPLGVFAAWTGDRARSAYLFEAGYADFANLPFWETDEVSRKRHPEAPVVGPFVANLGGFLTSLLYGLTRMRPDDGDPTAWFRGPAAMPELWDGIEVERLWVRGREVSLRARHGRPAELQPR